MPIDTSIRRDYPSALYNAPKKYVLVLSCVDYRLLDDLIRFLDHDNLANRYYHVTFAGASLGLVDHKSYPNLKDFSHWRRTFIEHVKATVRLTEGKLTDIYIVQHENCGAFELYYPGFKCMSRSEQLETNRRMAVSLQKDISEHFCEDFNHPYVDPCKDDCVEPVTEKDDGKVLQKHPPTVHAFFMDLRGNVQLLSHPALPNHSCPNHYCSDHKVFDDVSAIKPRSSRKKPKEQKKKD